jgi:hypothetical protein
MPNFAGTLRVDYVDSDGMLTHPYPTLAAADQNGRRIAAQPPRPLGAYETLALGLPGRDRTGADLPTWPFGGPFGTDLILAVVASAQLALSPGTNDEDATGSAGCLGRLAQEVERVRKAGGRVSGTIALVRTQSK